MEALSLGKTYTKEQIDSLSCPACGRKFDYERDVMIFSEDGSDLQLVCDHCEAGVNIKIIGFLAVSFNTEEMEPDYHEGTTKTNMEAFIRTYGPTPEPEPLPTPAVIPVTEAMWNGAGLPRAEAPTPAPTPTFTAPQAQWKACSKGHLSQINALYCIACGERLV